MIHDSSNYQRLYLNSNDSKTSLTVFVAMLLGTGTRQHSNYARQFAAV